MKVEEQTNLDILTVESVDDIRRVLSVVEGDDECRSTRMQLVGDLTNLSKSAEAVVQESSKVLRLEPRDDRATNLSHATCRKIILILVKKLEHC